jgi:glycine oxidase
VGGGIIGLALAWRLAQRGCSVCVLERERTGAGASSVAAGMLAPVSEVESGPHGQRALELALRSARAWRSFAQELEAASGCAVGLSSAGTLMVARDEDEARELERQRRLRADLGLAAERLRPSQARALEPALAPVVRLALQLAGDHSVDPLAVLEALKRACAASSVEIRTDAEVVGLERSAGDARRRDVGSTLRLAGGELVHAERVVIAAGAWSGALSFLPEQVSVPVRPVRGELLWLRDPSGRAPVARSIRGGRVYLVPRAGGRLVVGASMEERGFDAVARAGSVYELLRAAYELVPETYELQLEAVRVGFRPGTPDNLPLLGQSALPGLYLATGHFRNGILLAPLSAELMAGLLCEQTPAPEDRALLDACDPRRFDRGQSAGAAGRPESGSARA